MQVENRVKIIKRAEIPALTQIERDGKMENLPEVRDFRWAANLKDFLPHEDVVSFSWVKIDAGEIHHTHEHSVESMIIVYRGKGQITGQMQGPVEEGDVIAIPPGCAHGFIGGEPEGFFALSIQFGKGLYTEPESARVTFLNDKTSLESLLAFNEIQKEKFFQTRFIKVLTDGTLKNPNKRQRYLDALQIWSDKNQDLLYTRQATCADPKFIDMFLEHLNEEVGHDRMHADRGEKIVEANKLTEDPIIEALAGWFIQQMYVLDNIEKTALIHMVIENASHTYHKTARPVLAQSVNDEYFQVHEADTEHAEMGLRLLKHLSAEQYKRLHLIVDKGWKMINAMGERVCELTDQVK